MIIIIILIIISNIISYFCPARVPAWPPALPARLPCACLPVCERTHAQGGGESPVALLKTWGFTKFFYMYLIIGDASVSHSTCGRMRPVRPLLKKTELLKT